MKRIVLVGLVSICWADIFYVLDNKEDVNLEVTDSRNKVQVYLLKANEELNITQYKKICLKNIKSDVEVGIRESQDITLKKDSLCHDFEKFSEPIPVSTFLTKVILRFSLLKDIVTYSGEKELIALAGKGAEPVKVSRSKYPNLELDFSDISQSSVIKIYKNKKPISNVQNTFSFKGLEINDQIIIRVIKNGKKLYFQKFLILK